MVSLSGFIVIGLATLLMSLLAAQYYRHDLLYLLTSTPASSQSRESLLAEKVRLQGQLDSINNILEQLNKHPTPVAQISQGQLPGPPAEGLTTDVMVTQKSSPKASPKSQFLLREVDESPGPLEPSTLRGTTTTASATPSPPPVVDAKVVEIKKDATSTCPYRFKAYVYPIPTELAAFRFGEEARRNRTLHVCHKCILEQFSLEYIMYDFFTQFCGRTMNPDEADFFYLPLIRDAEYRLTMEDKGPRKRAPSSTEQALLDVIEKGNFAKWLEVFQVSDKYWKARQGGDHIIIMPAPVTNLRHESSKRGYFHYMMHLWSPIFVGLEYSASFVREYPVCSTQKNIMVPYPTTDPELYNGKLLVGQVVRDALLYYAGGVHGDCVEIRQAMKKVLINSTKLKGVVPEVKSVMSEREHGFRAAKFCPIPVGDSPSSKRMYDVMNFGCIPVVLSDDLVWAYETSTGWTMNRSTFSIQLPQSVVQFTAEKLLARFRSEPEKFGYLPMGESLYEILANANRDGAAYRNGIYVNPLVQILERVSQENIAYLQQGVVVAAPNYRFYALNESMTTIPTAEHVFPGGKAMEIFADMLQIRKDKGVMNIYKECKAEKERPGHGYLHRYPCEPNDRRRLLHSYFGAR
jgi:hypothetical protein